MIDYSNQQSKRLRVLFTRTPPETFDNCRKFPTLHPTLACPFPGWCAEVIGYLAEFMHLKIDPIDYNNVVGHVNWGKFVNGTWDGIFGMIYNGSIDTVCQFFQYTDKRAKYFSFSYPVTSSQLYYLVHARVMDFSSRMWNTFSPYGLSTWVALGLMLVLQSLYCICKMQVVWKLVRFQLYQPDSFDFITAAGNFSLLVFTVVQCRLLMDMYQTLLLSSLLQPPPNNPFTNAGEMIKLVARKQYQFVTNYKHSWYFEEILMANSSYEMSLRAAIGENIVETKNENSMTMVHVRSRCNFALISDGLPLMPAHFVFLKNSPILPALNKAIVMNRDFIRRTYRKYMLYGYRFDESARPEECSGKDKATRFYNKQHVQRSGRGENPEMKPLDLVAMFGIFCLFSIGSLLSILAFCIESSYYNKQQQLIYRQKLRIVLLGPVLAFPLAISGLAKQLDQRINTVEGGWRNTVESRRPTMADCEHEVSTEIGGF
uniref:Solute-binding protein family 3/N-terminal domain-containing protein n=1 Tax=Globodera rostochiensis TaxID=31243 RepID=A0A914HUJ6_GLORO